MNFLRQRNLISQDIFKNRVTVVGVGGIGSFLVLALAKMGFEDIEIYDNDTIEDQNLPNQFYPLNSIGKLKNISLYDLIKRFTGVRIQAFNARWIASENPQGVLISAVDNMDTRESMFNYAIENPKRVPLFIDGRMGRLQAEIYTVRTNNKKDIDTYKKRLWKSSQVEDIPCTEKAIIYNVLFIASMICSQLKLALEGKIYKPAIIADLENTELTFLK